MNKQCNHRKIRRLTLDHEFLKLRGLIALAMKRRSHVLATKFRNGIARSRVRFGHQVITDGSEETQPDDDARNSMRPDYANNADSLTMVSHVVATNFQTIAQANNYWR